MTHTFLKLQTKLKKEQTLYTVLLIFLRRLYLKIFDLVQKKLVLFQCLFSLRNHPAIIIYISSRFQWKHCSFTVSDIGLQFPLKINFAQERNVPYRKVN